MARVGMGGIVLLAAGVMTLTACGGGSDSKGSPSGDEEASTSPYHSAPWRLQVVHFLQAASHPGSGKYRAWTEHGSDFIYTPKSSGDPGWKDRTYDGTASVYLNELSAPQKKAVLDSVTHKGSVIPSTLEVTKAKGKPDQESDDYSFQFKVKTTKGKWLTGMALGSDGHKVKSGQVDRLSYDVRS